MPLMDMGFAVICPLARHRMPQIRFLYIGSYVCSTLLSDPPRGTPLRFAITSPPSGCEGDFHPRAVEHARHTTDGTLPLERQGSVFGNHSTGKTKQSWF